VGPTVIGYYVHHQGLGHLQRMRCIAACLDEPMTVLSSLPDLRVDRPTVALPLDNLHGSVDPTANGTLHWVPRHNDGLRRRMALIADWVNAADPDLMVVDVSVEVAMLCRLMGVPTVVMAMRGDRFDRAHRAAYDSAYALLAPWAADFAAPGWPEWWHSKTFHAGAISRFGDRPAPVTIEHDGARRALVLWGAGGGSKPDDAVAAAAAASPDFQWRIAAAAPDDAQALWDQLTWADVVITHGGQGAIAEVAAARRPAVVIAQDRPHDEQVATARALGDAGLAIALPGWPDPARWPDLLRSAMALDGRRWVRWAPPNAARYAADFLAGTAREIRAQRRAGGELA
jgi:UDP-N-acetylglucosamine--N-acetylmuramyl-(pentapeptide) pyrophosphoryl-undecaprenol N-acetylglucosamine transferase